MITIDNSQIVIDWLTLAQIVTHIMVQERSQIYSQTQIFTQIYVQYNGQL